MGDSSGNMDDDGGDDDDFVHFDDDLTWNMVARASGAEDPERRLRSNSTPNQPSGSSSRKKGKTLVSSSRPPLPSLRDSEEEVDVYLEQLEEENLSNEDESVDDEEEEDIEKEDVVSDDDLDDDLDDD